MSTTPEARRTRTCPRPGCGTTFFVTKGNRRHCSRACATFVGHMRRLGRDPITYARRTCKRCHVPLEPSAHGGRLYCSRKCRMRAHSPRYERTCPRCATPFVTTRSVKRYCTPLCCYLARLPPALIRGRYRKRSTHRVVTRWTLVGEPFEADGFSYGQCRCAHGHVQVVAVDVRPPPACERCQLTAGPVGRALEARS
jgi:hypothetical protein